MSNATAFADFERQLKAETKELFEKDVPRAVVGLALELRQQWEDNIAVGADAVVPVAKKDPWRFRRPGLLKSKVMATIGSAPKPLKDPFAEPGGHDEAAAALAGWKIGQPITVYDNVFYASFPERGTEKMAARPALLPALQLVGSRVVQL